MRTFTFILLAGMTLMLLGCGLSGGGQEAQEGEASAAETKTPAGTVAPPVETQPPASTVSPLVATETPTGTASPPVEQETPTSTEAPLSAAPVLYTGPTSLEERIFASPVIARARVDSTASTVESATIFDGSTKYIALLEFSFSVQEYLKGSGADDIVAVWGAAPFFDTEEEAEDALPTIAAARDAQWDDHEAIILLQQDFQAFLPSTRQADRYYLAWGGGWPIYALDDGYSLASRHNRLWLPSEAAVGAASQATGDQQRFLTAVPPATGTAPPITLGEIKTRIAAVTTKLNASDGSEEYTECVQLTYLYERQERHYKATYPSRSGSTSADDPPPTHELNAGLAAGTILYEDDLGFGLTTDELVRFWIDGGDANLFSVVYGDSVPYDFSGDGVNDSVNFNRRVVSARPLPESVYRFHFNIRSPFFNLCDGYTIRYEWTVTVNAPVGTLHEAFFDPVTHGTVVSADATKGVLKPATLTDANGASATLERIAWEPGTGDSGTVKLKVNPHTGLTGHVVDFIALDGSVPLSLKIADATVDAANRTLSWTVASQPWEDGDELMLRIRKGCGSGTAVTNPGANPGLVSDCEALLGAKDTLRGPASLDWSAGTGNHLLRGGHYRGHALGAAR